MVKHPPVSVGDIRDSSSIPGSGRAPGEGNEWQPPPVFLPGESHGQRRLEGYRPWGPTGLNTTKATEHAHAAR